MEHSIFVILEIVSVISVLIGLIVFVIAKTIENKNDLDDLYTEPVSWWAAFFYTLAPVWILALALLIMTVLILAFCGVCNFIIYMR
jgi:hypothetical protein